MRWRPKRRPRTEARSRRKNTLASGKGLTNQGPLQKPGLSEAKSGSNRWGNKDHPAFPLRSMRATCQGHSMMKRDDCFRALARHITDEIVIATYSSAVEWNDLNPRVLNYFSMGAMGLASSHGLGLALGRPDKRIVILDGDGSLLMNLGSLVTIGAAA